MTPKEKAKELVQKMRVHSPVWEIEGDAKQCALIAVDEVLNDDWYITTLEDLAERRKYWRQVKHEIENL